MIPSVDNVAKKMPAGVQSVRRVALGSVQFGLPYGIANQNEQVTRAEAGKMLALARESGIEIVDTAIAYGDSESCLGQAGMQEFKVVTKLPAVPDGCPDVHRWVEAQVAASLKRLNTDRLYGLLLHHPRQLLGPDGRKIARAVQNLKEAGKLQKAGVSAASPDDLREFNDRMKLDLVQAPLSLVDRRLASTGWLKRLHGDGVEIHARSIFLQGLLLMPQAAIPAKFSRWAALWDEWHGWLARRGVAAVQACMAFALGLAEIDRVVVGAQSVEQLQQIIAAAACPVDLGELPDVGCDAAELIDPSRWPNL